MSTLAALGRLYAYITTGSDHAAPAVAKADRDVYHATAGMVAGATIILGLAYAWIGGIKQDADDDDPAAVEDARLDRLFICAGTVAGAAPTLVLGLFAGWAWAAGYAGWFLLCAAVLIIASVKARGV